MDRVACGELALGIRQLLYHNEQGERRVKQAYEWAPRIWKKKEISETSPAPHGGEHQTMG